MRRIDRKTYFDIVRRDVYGGKMSAGQVDGNERVLAIWETHYQDLTSIPQLGYCLATDYHETSATMQPVHEYGNTAYFHKMYDIAGARPAKARELGNVQPGDGARYPGMGLVQSTGRSNARRCTKRLRELGAIGMDVDFEKTPELLMDWRYAPHIMFIGMEEGWFTNRTLDQIIDDKIDGDEFEDFQRARIIINGKDKAVLIAEKGRAFLGALKASVRDAPAIAPAVPVGLGPTPGAKPPAAAGAAPEPLHDVAAPDIQPPSAAEPAPAGWLEHVEQVTATAKSATSGSADARAASMQTPRDTPRRDGMNWSAFGQTLLGVVKRVAGNTNFQQAAVGAVTGIAQKLLESANDPTKIKELANELKQGAPALVGAMVKGTPAEPLVDPAIIHRTADEQAGQGGAGTQASQR